MKECPKCKRKLTRVFHGQSDELAIYSQIEEIILGNCCSSYYNYYCENCDEFFSL